MAFQDIWATFQMKSSEIDWKFKYTVEAHANSQFEVTRGTLVLQAISNIIYRLLSSRLSERHKDITT